jgi:Tol biopolymer transport system component
MPRINFRLTLLGLGVSLLLASAVAQQSATTSAPAATLQTVPGADPSDLMRFPEETHLKNIKQLTFGGQNAEAYFSADDKMLSFQSMRGDMKCDQIFVMNPDGSNQHMVSDGKGSDTCAYLYPDGQHILYSSTEGDAPGCPPRPSFEHGYVWPVYAGHDVWTSKLDGSEKHRLTTTPGYDAESTISRDGKHIVFTSKRDGDLDIYTMDIDGSNVKRLTNELGYDGGPFWSVDGKYIVYRAYHPKTPEEIKEYTELLAQNLIKPSVLEIWMMRADGSDKHQVTHLGYASFAPFMTPDDKKIIFSSNNGAAAGEMGNFELWIINVDGTGLERITYNPTFDGFPMFTSDGKKLVFASNRNGKPHETNVFIADWVP